MYWLRWHYHVKDIAGAPYKIKKKERKEKKKKEKQNNLSRQRAYTPAYGRSTQVTWVVDHTSHHMFAIYLCNPVLHGLLLILSTPEGWKAESA